jgi:hypothetical protein
MNNQTLTTTGVIDLVFNEPRVVFIRQSGTPVNPVKNPMNVFTVDPCIRLERQLDGTLILYNHDGVFSVFQPGSYLNFIIKDPIDKSYDHL